jgi:hypothetical protein
MNIDDGRIMKRVIGVMVGRRIHDNEITNVMNNLFSCSLINSTSMVEKPPKKNRS